MAGDDPAAQAGVAAGQQAGALGAQQILKAQTGEAPVAERSWAERTAFSYRPPSGLQLFPPTGCVGRTFVSGQMLCTYWSTDSEQRQRLPLISNVEFLLGSPGSAVTLGKIGLFDVASNARIAETADFSTQLNGAGGNLTRPLVTPLPTPKTPFWVGMLVVWTTTSPQVGAFTTVGGVGGALCQPPLGTLCCAHNGLADLPATLVPALSSNLVWFGLY